MASRDVLVALLTAAFTLTLTLSLQAFHGPSHSTTLGRDKAQGEKAFVLSVGLNFQDSDTADELLKAWATAAAWCLEHEPFLFAYEVAQSDTDPLKYVIIERYRSKEDYTGPHRRSPAFKAFRPQMRALQDSGRVSVTGQSYREMGIGFT